MEQISTVHISSLLAYVNVFLILSANFSPLSRLFLFECVIKFCLFQFHHIGKCSRFKSLHCEFSYSFSFPVLIIILL